MKLNCRLLLIVLVGFSNCMIGQDELDDIFDDPTRKLSLNIGSSLTGIASGIPNVEADLRLFNQFLIFQGGVGLTPFKYRLNLSEAKFMRGVGKGTMTQASIGFRLFEWDNWGSADMYLGPKIEFIQHKYSDLETLEKKGDFGFFNVEDGEMVYDRRERNFGIFLHVIYGLRPHLSMAVGGSGGYGFVTCRYDEESSTGIEWISPKPVGWTKGFFSTSAYFRFNFSLRYRIF
ncbi:MAG: hypothetical protein ACI837_001975 [Crocinitomicaceae bacterium]|jgi:hypothetical protein